jgi:hypothetical protein
LCGGARCLHFCVRAASLAGELLLSCCCDGAQRCGRALGAFGVLEPMMLLTQRQQCIEWFLLRILFLREYGVQIHFDFAKYTRKALTQAIMRSINITPATWIFMLACLVVFAVRGRPA